jgi:AraC-like DNA-binding protein/ligand-binding sensor protein
LLGAPETGKLFGMQAIAQPSPKTALSDKQLLEALSRSKVYRQYERTFNAATGLPLALQPVESFGLPFRGKRNENSFCAFLAEGKGTCTLCLQTQGHVNNQPGDQPRSIQCPFGLTETRVPVQLGDRVIGFLATGQVFTRAPQSSTFKKAISRVLPSNAAAQRKAARLWKQSPEMEASRYAATVQLLGFFAKQLSAASNQIRMEVTTAEPVVVTKAREFIARNKAEPLTLSLVSKAAGSSMFHFCKVFKSATGLRFTEYVSRLRLEDAKQRLLNPNARVSEVAFDVGFQSLTQFNRSFNRVIGLSPREFREKLMARGLTLAA